MFKESVLREGFSYPWAGALMREDALYLCLTWVVELDSEDLRHQLLFIASGFLCLRKRWSWSLQTLLQRISDCTAAKHPFFVLLCDYSGVVKIQMKLLCLRLDSDYSVKLIQYSFSHLKAVETVGWTYPIIWCLGSHGVPDYLCI